MQRENVIGRSDPLDLEDTNSALLVRWRNEPKRSYPYRWLRFECSCASCGNSRPGLKWLRLVDVPADVRPREFRVTGNELQIVWEPDGHRSTYAIDWLRRHSLDASSYLARRLQPKLWRGTHTLAEVELG